MVEFTPIRGIARDDQAIASFNADCKRWHEHSKLVELRPYVEDLELYDGTRIGIAKVAQEHP